MKREALMELKGPINQKSLQQ